MSSTFIIHEHTIPGSHIREYARSTANSQDEPLMLHVKRYVPKDYTNPRKGDITIVGAHANGFPKEMYEPMWELLYRLLREKDIQIRGIWIADAAWQNESSHINRHALGNDPCWLDYSRDIGQMINHFRLPRPLMGVGHSFGGCALTGLSLSHPRLFSSIMLIDPVIDKQDSLTTAFFANFSTPAALSVVRRDMWPSREEAAAAFKKSKFYQSWDPEVLGLWVRYGLRELPSGQVTLATPKAQEVHTFLRPTFSAYDESGKKLINKDAIPDVDFTYTDDEMGMYPVYRPESSEVFRRLPHVRPSVLYIFGEESYISLPEKNFDKMQRTGTGIGGSGGEKLGRVKKIIAKGHGHLIPMESPAACAEPMSAWIQVQLARWWDEEKAYEEWVVKSPAEKSDIDESLRKFLDRNNKKKEAKI